MKKLLFVIALLLSLPIFGQIEPSFENKIVVDEDGSFFFSRVNSNHFIFLSSAESLKDKKKTQWKISYFKDDLNLEWNKTLTVDKELSIDQVLEVSGNFIFVFNENTSNLGIKPFYNIIKIDADGVITNKEIDYKNFANVSSFYINQDALYYIDLTSKMFKINKIDIETLNITSKELDDTDFPKYCMFSNIKFHNNILYARLKEQHLMSEERETDFDKILTFDKDNLIAQIPVKIVKNASIEQSNMLDTDSTHLFFFGISKKWINGNKNNDENYDYRLFLTPLNKDELEGSNTLDASFYNQLAEKRTIKVKNAAFLQGDKVYGNGYVINNSFRIGINNYLVFDKYQAMLYPRDEMGEKTILYYTNSVIYCFNDSGEIIWSNSIDYSIYSKSIGKQTFAAPIDNETIGLTGLFNNKYSTIRISAETGKVSNNENIETNTTYDYDIDYPLSSIIRPLSNTEFITVEKVNETKEQEKMRKKNKDYNIGVNLKVYKIQ
jgi:hypothetical protein